MRFTANRGYNYLSAVTLLIDIDKYYYFKCWKMIFSKVISQQFNHYQYVRFRQESMTFLDHYVYWVRGPNKERRQTFYYCGKHHDRYAACWHFSTSAPSPPFYWHLIYRSQTYDCIFFLHRWSSILHPMDLLPERTLLSRAVHLSTLAWGWN